jgi:hypothetical protein
MNLRNFPRRNISPAVDSAHSTVKNQMEEDPPSAGLPRSGNNRDLRLIVENQFMRMNEAHDRHRAEVLGSYSPGPKFKM